eukprot:CFRG1542T1
MRVLGWLAFFALGLRVGVFGLLPPQVPSQESYEENLTIKPLHNNDLLMHFEYTFRRPFSSIPQKHFSVFPRTVAEVTDGTGVSALSVSLTQGRWHQERWGLPILSTPTGAEVWARFDSHSRQINDTQVDLSWNRVMGGLSGLLCASLNFVQPENTGKPVMLFGRDGAKSGTHSAYRFSTLSRENVCTENLTPLIKLLPCRSEAGIASMMNAYRVFNSEFVSLSLRLRMECEDALCEVQTQVLVLSVDVVPTRVKENPSMPHLSSYDWTLSSLLDTPVPASCAVADRSEIYIVTSDVYGERTLIQPTPMQTFTQGPFSVAVYQLGIDQELQVFGKVLEPTSDTFAANPSAPIVIHRTLTGYGQQFGGVAATITNHQSRSLRVVYYETIPWFLRVYFHTLKVDCDCAQPDKIITHRRLVPSRDREQPMEIELTMDVPSLTTITVSFSFEKAFIKVNEHPPDANRGFDVGAAVVEFGLPCSEFPFDGLGSLSRVNRSATRFRLHSETLVVSMPVPDFSMPYNVVVLSCTVLTLAFGFVYNISTRSFQRVVV